LLASLRQHFIDSLSPEGAEGGSRIFAQLKTRDDDKLLRGMVKHIGFKEHIERTAHVHALAAALVSDWLRPMLGEAAIVNGSGSFLGRGWIPSRDERLHGTIKSSIAELAVRPSDDSAWVRYRPQGCEGIRNWTALIDSRLEERMVKAQLAIKWCGQAIARHERQIGRRFDLVAFSRPDLVRWSPMPAWCTWKWPIALVCNKVAHDGAWVVSRNVSAALFRMPEAYAACNDSLHVTARHRDVPPSCCFSAESILKFVTADVPKDATGCAFWGRATFLRSVQRQLPAGSPAHRRHSRSYRHVCDIVTSETYAQGSYAHSVMGVMGGLPIDTGVELRRLFFNNTEACRQALTPYDLVELNTSRTGSDGGDVRTQPNLWLPFMPRAAINSTRIT